MQQNNQLTYSEGKRKDYIEFGWLSIIILPV